MAGDAPDRRLRERSLLEIVSSPDTPEDARRRARDELVTLHLPLVRHCARRFAGSESPDDLAQIGTVGLIRAIDGFDTSRAGALSSYAVPWIIGEIQHHLRDSTRPIRARRAIVDLQPRISRAIEELEQEQQRSPTVRELAERAGARVDDVVEALELRHGVDSLDADEDGADPHPGVLDGGFTDVENRETVRILLDELPDLERRVVLLRFYRNRTQSQIAEELGMSQMQVSRLLARSLASMRTAAEAA